MIDYLLLFLYNLKEIIFVAFGVCVCVCVRARACAHAHAHTYMRMLSHMPQDTCGGQRTPLWNWFSPSTFMQVQWLNSACQAFSNHCWLSPIILI